MTPIRLLFLWSGILLPVLVRGQVRKPVFEAKPVSAGCAHEAKDRLCDDVPSRVINPGFEFFADITGPYRVAGMRTSSVQHVNHTPDAPKMPVHEHGPQNKFEAAIGMSFLIGIPLFMLCMATAVVIFLKYDPVPLPIVRNPGDIQTVFTVTAAGLVLDTFFHFADTVLALALIGEFTETDSFPTVALRLLFFAFDIVLFVLALLTTVYFFMRRSGTRNLFVMLVCLWVLSSVLNITLAAFTGRSGWFYVKEIFRILLFTGLWGPFFASGSEVRGIFVKRLTKTRPPRV